jgi:hypothetical protein
MLHQTFKTGFYCGILLFGLQLGQQKMSFSKIKVGVTVYPMVVKQQKADAKRHPLFVKSY